MAQSSMFSNFRQTLPSRNRYTFDIHNIDLALVNAVRRIILTNIPVVGFDGEINPTLQVLRNDGPLHNEFMLHRFGLIPIFFNEDETENFMSDDYMFELDVENKTSLSLNVTTHHFNVYKDETRQLPQKEVLRLFPADSITKHPILITRLRPGEGLHVRGRAIKSSAQYHAGFSPVSLCTMSFIGGGDDLTTTHTTPLDKERSYAKNKYGDPTHIQFEIETETALVPKYLVSKSFDIIMQKLHKVLEEIHKDDSEFVHLDMKSEGHTTSVQVTFQNEDDTLGNFLQSSMHNHYIRDKKPTVKNIGVSYVGYCCPHPLESIMILSIHFASESITITQDDIVSTLKEHCERVIMHVQNVQVEWNKNAI